MTAKAVIVAEVERLHWRIWNGKAKNAERSIKRIRKVMHVFKGEHSQGVKGVASRKLWHELHAVVNISEAKPRGWSTMPSGTVPVCGRNVDHRGHGELLGQPADEQVAADEMVDEMGADLLLEVRCAVYNGTLGAGFGHRFNRIADADLNLAEAG